MAEPLLRIEDLTISFPSRQGQGAVVRSVSFEVGAEIVAVVGESGSGKSLTGRAIMGLLPPRAETTAKTLSFEGRDLTRLAAAHWRALRGSAIALILQDPKYSLNPSMRVGRQVEETLLLHTSLSARERREKALAMLSRVGFDDPQRVHASYPRELSGGMGQRAMIAAMLINKPSLLIADEATSALDHDLQVQILELLGGLTRELGMGLLLISHDLQQVARFADRVLVMRQGTIVDRLAASELADATHPYTLALWNARPSGVTYGTRLPTVADEMEP
ncbi:ABC transporter ATP-binding protein [Mesorhizobium sp. dw_380]|uniref:ABC transporter ATP-binding protein n=1 Tax=Mesorhizobium sp. dw_380 TaxID=2812001 RepID=UPI001BDEF9F9|nr:ABC transporter ATP-binding protein [Mesorhizobium sp. dw_380]